MRSFLDVDQVHINKILLKRDASAVPICDPFQSPWNAIRVHASRSEYGRHSGMEGLLFRNNRQAYLGSCSIRNMIAGQAKHRARTLRGAAN